MRMLTYFHQSERKQLLSRFSDAPFEVTRNAIAAKVTGAIKVVEAKRYKGIYYKYG